MAEIVNGAGINNVDAHVQKSRSRFNLNELFLDTHRFGEIHPHFIMDGVTSDKHPFRCIHDARSYTLRAPLMQDITMNKDYFMVTLRSILPLQSERVVTQPNLGDDVPADAYTSISDFVAKVSTFVDNMQLYVADTNNAVYDRVAVYLKSLILLESVFSRGSLLTSLGCSLSSCLAVEDTSDNTNYNIDETIDQVARIFATYLSTPGNEIRVTIDSVQYYLVGSYKVRRFGSKRYLILRDFLQKIRDTSDWAFDATFPAGVSTSIISHFTDADFHYNTSAGFPIDLARLWAYHLIVAEYFSNDKVDYIYSADLFRQYVSFLVSAFATQTGHYTFNWNGQKLFYDYLSAHFFNMVIGQNFNTISSSGRITSLQYLLTLFGYARSLRFKDYFTGSRTRPLAMVTNSNYSTDVAVNANKVSVIDVTRSIQVQRFLNAVNASGRKFGEYLDALFGVRPNKDMHEPIFLAHSSDSLFASENENTGDAVYQNTGGMNTSQNSITAVFRGNSNNFEYSVDVNEPCIIMGVTSYDIERVYADTIQRSFFIRDRFDMFQPHMQYIGDQPVYKHELVSGDSSSFASPMGYQFRDMQYKLMFPRCAGAFASDMLPGFAFVYDLTKVNNSSVVISPDFIRAKNSELDEFYLSLSGYSLGTYFHFILRQRNVDDTSRPMAAQPQIL